MVLGSGGVDIEHDMLKWGIRRLSELRLNNRRSLTKATEYHLGRALDKDGTGGVSEEELLHLVVPSATARAGSGAKRNRPSVARFFGHEEEEHGHGESKGHNGEDENTKDLLHRTKEELVAMLLDAQRQLAAATTTVADTSATEDQHRADREQGGMS